MKLMPVKLFVQLPSGEGSVELIQDGPDRAKLREDGTVIACEQPFNTWRVIGEVPRETIPEFMENASEL